MFVIEYKLRGKQTQYTAINQAIRTVQFIRNKCLRFWMDGKNIGQKDIYRYSTKLRKEFSFADKLNSTACQKACERAWTAIAKFYDNCKKKIKGKKGYPKFSRSTRSVEFKKSGWKLDRDRKRITFTDKNKIG